MSRINGAAAAGCGYWRRASEGEAFYTTPEDHENCPVGAFTHGAELTAQQGQALQGLVGTMIELKYLRAEEVGGIPHRDTPMQVVAYAPLAAASFEPDVIIFRGNARQIMLLMEAAGGRNGFEAGAVMGRPACAMVPQALRMNASVTSVGCVGNRVYTGIGDDELYLTVTGLELRRMLGKLGEIVAANVALERFHRERALLLAG